MSKPVRGADELPDVGTPVERVVGRPAEQSAEPVPHQLGRVAYEAWAKSRGDYRPWSDVERFAAEARDWHCAAEAVICALPKCHEPPNVGGNRLAPQQETP